MSQRDIRIGTLVPVGENTASYLQQMIPHGFESFQLTCWQNIPKGLNLKKFASEIKDVLDAAPTKPVISSLGIFGNPLTNKSNATDWGRMIDACSMFGCNIVAGFAGGVVGKPVPESMKTYKKVFAPLAKRAADKGVKLAFENCIMDSRWDAAGTNIAYCPKAWEMMFDILPAKNVGLEWEPCHQMCQLIDPLPQLEKWIDKIFHLHGKDATIFNHRVAEQGIACGETLVYHRTPGFGDTNWTDVISILRMGGFKGAIDIEGFHDPVYRDKLETTGQVHALNYLKQCRGGEFVPNPK